MTEIKLGRVGVWTWAFDQQPWVVVRDALAEIEALGYVRLSPPCGRTSTGWTRHR